MTRQLCDPPNVRRVFPVPDTEPTDTEILRPYLRAAWITDSLVRELEEDA